MARLSTGLFKSWMRKEASWGVYPTDMDTDSQLIFNTGGGIGFVPTKEVDPAMMGNAFSPGSETINKLVQGSIPFSYHPEGTNTLLYHALGKVKSTGAAPRGSLCIFYSGAAESCLMHVANNQLSVFIGAEGAEVLDVNFNLTGIMDFTDLAFNTIAKCVTAINTYTDYRAFAVGDTASNTGLIADQPAPLHGSATISNTGALGAFTGATVPAFAPDDYDLDISIDGGSVEQVTVSLVALDDWDDVALKIQTALRALTAKLETVTIAGGKFVVTATSFGPTSSVEITAGTAGSAGGDLLAAITALSADYTATIDTPVTGGAYQSKGAAFQSRTVKLDSILGVSSYKHTLTSMSIGENADSFTYVQSLGLALAQAFTGLKAGQLTLDMPNGGLITGNLSVIGKEMFDVTPPAISTFEKTRPQVSGRVQFYINAIAFGYNAVNIDYNPSLFAEVEGASMFQGEAQNGKISTCSISPGYHWNEDTKREIYDRLQNDEKVEVIAVFQSEDYAETLIKYGQFWRFTLCQITESQPDLGGEVFNLPSKLDVLQPTEATFRPVEVEVISKRADLTA